MQVYIDKDKDTVSVVQSVASASTMISSVTAEIKDYIVSKFPPNFFKDIYVDTTQTISDRSRNEKYNPYANKKPYPTMSITPEISLDDSIGGMEKGLHLSSPNLYLRKDLNRSYRKLVVDPDNLFSIYYTSDYITTNLNFKIITNSYIQNVDTAFYLKSKFQQGFFQYLNDRYIETEIPKSLIKLVADIMNYDLDDCDDMNSLRLYLIGTSKSEDAIKKKLNPSTGKQCFFINEKSNFLTLFTDLDCPPSIIRESQVEGEYTISFRIQVSCWLPNAFVLDIDYNKLKQLSEDTIDMFDSEYNIEEGIFTQSIHSSKILNKKDTIRYEDANGEEQIGILVYYETFTRNINEPLEKIYLLDNLKSEFSSIYRYILDSQVAIDMSSLVKIKVFSKNGEMNSDLYDINYDELSLDFKKSVDSDIVVALYVNRLAYESFKVALKSDKFYFNSNFLTTLYANIDKKAVKFVVRSFVNSRENASTNDNLSLRVKTPYGIGYIGLKDSSLEKTINAYRVCVGYNGEIPIIKELEIK